jgi:hypothetical protein
LKVWAGAASTVAAKIKKAAHAVSQLRKLAASPPRRCRISSLRNFVIISSPLSWSYEPDWPCGIIGTSRELACCYSWTNRAATTSASDWQLAGSTVLSELPAAKGYFLGKTTILSGLVILCGEPGAWLTLFGVIVNTYSLLADRLMANR